MSSHRQIFKSTALIGGTQIINMVIGILRTKALAMMLGAAGMGVAGLYQTATALIGSVAGLGLNASGVRQIAEAGGTGDLERIARTAVTLRRVSLLSGLLGMILVIILAPLLSRTTFGDSSHVGGILLMSLTLLFGGISAGQAALLQGLRRLRDLAISQIAGTVFGAVVSVLLVRLLGASGIVPYLVAISAFAILSTWWYSRRIELVPVHVTWSESLAASRGLLKMGVALTVAALIASGSAYLTRVLVQQRLGVDGVGIYTAAWTLSSYYIGFVLTAMGTDFMPRLTASNQDHATMNRLVNEQSEMGVLIALPGVIATLTLAPYVMNAFYSAEFVQGTGVVRWQILGIFLRVVSWPLGYILIAKGKSVMFTLTEFAFGVASVVLIFLCMKVWGLDGVGISFALSYLGYTVMMVAVAWWVTGFRWSSSSAWILLSATLLLSVMSLGIRFLPTGWCIALGMIMTVASSWVCLRILLRLLNVDLMASICKKFLPSRT